MAVRRCLLVTTGIDAVRVRRFIAGVVGAAAFAPLSVETGYVADLLSDQQRTSAILMLRSLREIRRPAVKLMAERLGCATWSLYFVGSKVLISRDGMSIRLLDQGQSVLGELRSASSALGALECVGPGLEGPRYALWRR